MSWQAYVDNNLLGTKKLNNGAIIGLDGNVWAKSGGLNITPTEGKNIVAGFSNNSLFQSAGLNCGGVKYMFLRSQDHSVIGKKGQAGIHISKTGKAYIIGVYDTPTLPSEAAIIVEKLADYLISVGF